MRNLVLCGLVLALDIAFALSAAKTLSIPVFSATWAGVPLSVWAGIGGILALVALTLAVSLLAFPSRDARS